MRALCTSATHRLPAASNANPLAIAATPGNANVREGADGAVYEPPIAGSVDTAYSMMSGPAVTHTFPDVSMAIDCGTPPGTAMLRPGDVPLARSVGTYALMPLAEVSHT